MIPTKIELHNFGAIKDTCIDISDITLASVVGSNGVGKSTAFTIAPLWALFGGTKNGCSPDHLVRLGESDARVAIEFEHRGSRYRVTRTRTTNGRGKSSLELQKNESGAWVSLSGATIRETEEKIRNLLGLDEETFTASSMILQGRANEFTAKAPGQRKQILAQILGLEVYERLEAAAKQRAARLDIECSGMRARMSDLEKELEGKDEIEAGVAEIGKKIRGAEKRLSDVEAALSDAEAALLKAVEARAKARNLEMRLSGLGARIAEGKRRMDSLAGERARLEELVEQEPEILALADKLAELLETVRDIEALEPVCEALRREHASLSNEARALAGKKAGIDARMRGLRADLERASELRAAAEELPQLRRALDEQITKRERVVVLEREAERIEHLIRERTYALDAARMLIEAEIRNRESLAAKLADSRCVNPDAAKKSPCAFLFGAVAAAKELPRLREELESLDDPEIIVLQGKLASANEEKVAVGYEEALAEKLAAEVRELELLAERAGSLASKAETVALLEEQAADIDKRVSKISERLDAIRADGEGIKKRLAELPRIRNRVDELREWGEKKDQLPVAKERIRGIHEQMDALAAEIEHMRQESDVLADELGGKIQSSDVLASEMRVEELRKERDDGRNTLQRLHVDLGVAKMLLSKLDSAETSLERLRGEFAPMVRELTRHKTLAKAFGRDGIPALVIENAVPELERLANEILCEMSNGKHSLRFETQRELKSRAGMAETLDIIVSDWAGSRPYETFSGGEQLRIDYAIRFALAELLAQRAGNRIEWLVIDEGLGSQDREHRELVLDAIRSVAPRFRRVLMITHVEEAQGVFPQQIRFEPSEDGVDVIVG